MTSVKQKVAGIEKECGEVQSSVKRMRGAIKEQERANAAAARHIDEGAKKLQGAIREQGKINAEAAQEMGASIQKLQGAIRNQSNKNTAYIRDFYFGEGKK